MSQNTTNNIGPEMDAAAGGAAGRACAGFKLAGTVEVCGVKITGEGFTDLAVSALDLLARGMKVYDAETGEQLGELAIRRHVEARGAATASAAEAGLGAAEEAELEAELKRTFVGGGGMKPYRKRIRTRRRKKAASDVAVGVGEPKRASEAPSGRDDVFGGAGADGRQTGQ